MIDGPAFLLDADRHHFVSGISKENDQNVLQIVADGEGVREMGLLNFIFATTPKKSKLLHDYKQPKRDVKTNERRGKVLLISRDCQAYNSLSSNFPRSILKYMSFPSLSSVN